MARSPERRLVARTFRGQLTKPVDAYSEAYIRRLARAIERDRAAGRKPERQRARGHAKREIGGKLISTEHPRGRVRRGGELVPWSPAVKPTPIRKGADDRHVAGHGVIVQRDFRSRYAAWRWARRLEPGTGVQIIARGELAPEYGQSGVDVTPDEIEETPDLTYRAIYTGDSEGDVDENGASAAEYEDLVSAEARVFVPGSTREWIVRWQR